MHRCLHVPVTGACALAAVQVQGSLRRQEGQGVNLAQALRQARVLGRGAVDALAVHVIHRSSPDALWQRAAIAPP